MGTSVINLQPLLKDAHGLFDALIQCISNLNKLACRKDPKLKKYPFGVTSPDGGKILLQFTPNKKSRFTVLFDRVDLEPGMDEQTKVNLIQHFVFNGCRAHDLFEDVPMTGTLERNLRTYFSFELEGMKYEYVLWTPPVEIAAKTD